MGVTFKKKKYDLGSDFVSNVNLEILKLDVASYAAFGSVSINVWDCGDDECNMEVVTPLLSFRFKYRGDMNMVRCFNSLIPKYQAEFLTGAIEQLGVDIEDS